MDLPNTDRAVGSNAPKTPQRPLKRKNFAEPQLRPPSSPKKKQKKKEGADPDWYEIKGILNERKSGKITEYLIDWEDHPRTGQTYEPTWEPYANVTEVAIFEWKNKQASSKNNSGSLYTTLQDSEPIRPPKPRRTNSREASTSLKKGRLQNPNRAIGGSVGTKNKPQEIKDSYEDQHSTINNPFSIVIPFNKDINPTEYTILRSSQVSNYSNSGANLPISSSPLQNYPPSSQIILPRRRSAPAFIWDEDLESESQYLSGSTTYNPPIPKNASDCEEVPCSVQPEVSGRVRKGIARSSSEALITQHTDTVDTVTVATEEEQQEQQDQQDNNNNNNNINRKLTSQKSTIPDSFIIDSSSSIDLNPVTLQQSAPQKPLTPKPQQNLRSQSQPLGPIASEELSQLSPITDLLPASRSLVSASQNSFARSPGEEAEQSESRKQLQSQQSLEIPDSSQAQGVNAHTSSQGRAFSLPINQSQPKAVLSDSQRSQSLPSAAIVDSSSEETWQAAQIVSQLPRTSSQDLYPENSQSQGSKDHVQVPESTPIHRNRHPISNSLSEAYGVTNNRGTRAEVPETQLSASEVSAGAVSPQILASIEFDADRHSAQVQYQDPRLSRDRAHLASSISNSLPPRPASLIEKMSTVGSSASHLAVGERRARSSKSRSPSVVPPRVATAPPVASANHPLPMRDSITDTSRPRNRAISLPRTSIESASMNPDILTVRKLGQNEFIIPLPMMTQVRDVYDATIKNKRNDIISFLGQSSTLIDSDSMDMMVEELKLICDHQDLIVEESSTQSMDDSAQARYAVTISTKFLFIHQFLDSLRASKVHVVILARDAILPILEALFRWQQYNYNRPDISGIPGKSEKDLMQITLLPTWIDVRDCIVAPASVVVAFDSSFSASQGGDDYYQTLPVDPKYPDKRAPLLWLVTTNSIEHLEQCIPTTLESSERKARLVQYVAQTRKLVGRLDTSIYPDSAQAARGAAEYVLDDSREVEWPLMPMPDIDIAVPGHGANSRQSDSLTQSLFSPKAQSGFKRPSNFDTVDEDTAIKRQRLTPSRQGRDPGTSIMNGTIADLNMEIKSLRFRCHDYEKSIKRIQPKYQRALDERARFEHENAQVLKRESEYVKKLEIQDGAAAKLREENASLKNELAVARNSLATHENPSIAELQKAKDDLHAAQVEIERLKKGQASAEKRADYATSLYQTNSQQAQEMRNELNALQSECENLRSQASAARIEINKINHDGIIQQQVDNINILKRELAERERMLETVTRQLDAYTNGRRTTRGTSVPRSPRMNNMSPRPRVMGSNAASRGNSPAPGIFGGEMFQGGDAGRRFGAHLRED